MNPKNIYQIQPPDFLKLSNFSPSLKPFLLPSPNQKSGFTIDFKDPEAVRQLTCALAKKDFNLKLSLPQDRLCPTIPGRLDYCLWIVDILEVANQTTGSDQVEVWGIDIGTGSSAIYVLLLSRLLVRSKFLATEVDEKSYKSAQSNVELNNLSSSITIIRSDPSSSSSILPKQAIQTRVSPDVPSFTICNPPFYESESEILELSEKRDGEPSGVCTGAVVEMVTEGGEREFITRMIRESVELKLNIRWFTSLCGKYSTLSEIVKVFKSLNGENYAINELVQGQTRRWAFAWSWQDYRLPDGVSRSLSSDGPRLKSYRQLLPLPNRLTYHLPPSMLHQLDEEGLIQKVSETLRETPGLTVKAEDYRESQKTSLSGADFVIFGWDIGASSCSWTRRERRIIKSKSIEDEKTKGELKGDKSPLIKPRLILSVRFCLVRDNSKTRDEQKVSNKVKCTIDDGQRDESFSKKRLRIGSSDEMRIEIDWIKGFDRKSFESFWNYSLKKIIL
ncbi:hypothetical protein BY996DRAFT_4576550 [Phakopsora pachyrhizi]|uniref:U6 small nuclear RNA (adenine-(43)-N(6))-methyltransferase n=1 Tax=Phakopsora pachyrhizi TaxID=170000 RepID=A0AAV0B496_PHAPC|nr:hypothetical protein BY996DRAFT_4576550 [Phakopsora pachyrhizi]CAH7681345.1 hypothetical protein PPACK8108_LOCUS13928 [Phakopsora pachyrhizi]